VIVPGRDSGEIDRDIARLYRAGKSADEIASVVGIGPSSVGRRLTKMFRHQELPRRPR